MRFAVELGDSGPLYLLAGAAALFGLALFAITRPSQPKAKPKATRAPAAAAKTARQPRKRAAPKAA